MSQGVPGTSPPQLLLDALGAASSSNASSGYCDAHGEPALREALAQEMKFVYGQHADVTADDVSLTAGCNLAFVASAVSLADAGDEVILPVPWYAAVLHSLVSLSHQSFTARYFNHQCDIFLRTFSVYDSYTRRFQNGSEFTGHQSCATTNFLR
jgi:aspartate/methionine/tyrosine aminotransferase